MDGHLVIGFRYEPGPSLDKARITRATKGYAQMFVGLKSLVSAACLTGSILALTACDDAPPPPRTPIELARDLATYTSWNRVAGYSVAVFGPDQVAYSGGFGYSDAENKVAFTDQTSLNVASISKTVIALALLRAAEDGFLGLDDPVNKHLRFQVTNPHFPNSQITLRHLAMHTSSIRYSEEVTDHLALKHSDMSLAEFLANYLEPQGIWYSPDNFHRRAPGDLGDYSNVTASLCALAIENAVGMPFDDYTMLELFEPLGMENTTWYRGADKEPLAAHYTITGKGEFERKEFAPDALYPSGTLMTSARDLTSMAQMVLNGGELGGKRILSEQSIDTMLDFKSFESLDDDIHRQGLFWYETRDQLGVEPVMYGHNGGHDSAFSMLFIDPETDRGIIMLGNTNLDGEHNHISYFNIYKALWYLSQAPD